MQNFYNPEDFSQFQELISKYQVVREEFLNLDVPLMDINREKKHVDDVINEIFQEIVKGNPYGWVKGWGQEGGNDNWLQLGLCSHSKEINEFFLYPFLREKMPQTYEILKKIDAIHMCALVNLKPRTILNRHTHPYINEQSLLQLHLPLVTAKSDNYNYINCNGEFKQHVEGIPIVFDGSLNHFALNESDEDRIIMYIEFKKH